LLQKLRGEEELASRENWKEGLRKYGHNGSTLLTWELNDLEWLLELKEKNDMPAFVQVGDGVNQKLERVSSEELIRRLQVKEDP